MQNHKFDICGFSIRGIFSGHNPVSLFTMEYKDTETLPNVVKLPNISYDCRPRLRFTKLLETNVCNFKS